MKRKFSVYMHADAGHTVDVEVEIPNGATDEQIADIAIQAAVEDADLYSCEIADWSGEYEITGEPDKNGKEFSWSSL